MTASISYDLADFVVGNGCDIGRLHDEIVAAELASATIDGVTGPAVGPFIVSSDVAYDVNDEAAIDALVAAHNGAEHTLKIARYADIDDHTTHDYTAGLHQRLHKVVQTMFRGEVRSVDYFDMTGVLADPDPATWDCVLMVAVVYTRDATGLATSRETTRTWCQEDGSPHPVNKVTHKIYSNFEAMGEGTRRRQNVIEDVSLTLVGLLLYSGAASDYADAVAKGTSFTSMYDSEINNYVRVGSDELDTAVLADTTTTWLDQDLTALGYPGGTTIRDVIDGEIDDIIAPPRAWQ